MTLPGGAEDLVQSFQYLGHVQCPLEVRRADGSEKYLTFTGEVEHPEPGEVIFADTVGNAHARRWCNRQSGLSAVRHDTRRALIVAEALHQGAIHDVERLRALLVASVMEAWPTAVVASTRL